MSCGHVEEYDTLVLAKDNEIAALLAQLAEQKRQSTPSSDTLSAVKIRQKRTIEKVAHHLQY